MHPSFAQPLLNAGVADCIGRGGDRQRHAPPFGCRPLLRTQMAGLALFFLGFLVLSEDARQVGALPVVEGTPGIQRLPRRLTDASGRKQRKRVIRAAAAPGIHHHPIGDP